MINIISVIKKLNEIIKFAQLTNFYKFCKFGKAYILTLLLLLACSCSNNNSSSKASNSFDYNTDDYRDVLDTEGNYIKVPKNIHSIASMAPAVTDLILALGFYDQLTLVDYYSYQVGKSIATNDKIAKTDMLNPNIEAIVESGCNVVFISDINHAQDRFEMLKSLGIVVINIPMNNRLHEIGDSIMFMGRILNQEARAKSIADELNRELLNIQRLSKTVAHQQKLYFEMESPPNIYTFGSGVYINDIINLIGAENIFENQKGWIKVSAESVIERNPDVIIAFDRHGSSSIANDINTRVGWQHIKAIENGRVLMMNNDGILSRPTHNIIKPIKEIAKYIYPDVYASLE